MILFSINFTESHSSSISNRYEYIALL